MNRILAIIGVVVIGLGVVAMSTMYTVHQTEQALVLLSLLKT